jgi:hypothetical protein
MKLPVYYSPLLDLQERLDSDRVTLRRLLRQREWDRRAEARRAKREERLRNTPFRVRIYAAAHGYVSLAAAEKALLKELGEN